MPSPAGGLMILALAALATCVLLCLSRVYDLSALAYLMCCHSCDASSAVSHEPDARCRRRVRAVTWREDCSARYCWTRDDFWIARGEDMWRSETSQTMCVSCCGVDFRHGQLLSVGFRD